MYFERAADEIISESSSEEIGENPHEFVNINQDEDDTSESQEDRNLIEEKLRKLLFDDEEEEELEEFSLEKCEKHKDQILQEMERRMNNYTIPRGFVKISFQTSKFELKRIIKSEIFVNNGRYIKITDKIVNDENYISKIFKIFLSPEQKAELDDIKKCSLTEDQIISLYVQYQEGLLPHLNTSEKVFEPSNFIKNFSAALYQIENRYFEKLRNYIGLAVHSNRSFTLKAFRYEMAQLIILAIYNYIRKDYDKKYEARINDIIDTLEVFGDELEKVEELMQDFTIDRIEENLMALQCSQEISEINRLMFQTPLGEDIAEKIAEKKERHNYNFQLRVFVARNKKILPK